MSGRSAVEMRAARRALEIRRALGRDVRILREDAGVTKAAVARAARVDAATLCRLEASTRLPRLPLLVRIADALGADVSIRVVPGVGLPVRDRIQSRMVEAFLRALHPNWKPALEVPVVTPARGVIDAVLRQSGGDCLVAVEFQSQLRRVEQVLRWSAEKSAGLAAARSTGERPCQPPTVLRLLVLRSTPATRRIVQSLAATFASAYPADPREAVASLREGTPLVGSALVWMEVRGSATHLLQGRPRELRTAGWAGLRRA